MSGRDKAITAGALAGCLASILVASAILSRINAVRQELQLTVHPEVLLSMPPETAVTVVGLSVFRGVAIDYLWLRAAQLEQKRMYHEANQLTEWITMLQPRYEEVWTFSAWNMAFNLSAESQTKEERWMWIQAGIRLLRDRGIPRHNPDSINLHRYLATIFRERIAKQVRSSDPSNLYFKQQFAREWQDVLGAPPDVGERELLAWFGRMATAPSTGEKLKESNPAAAAALAALDAMGDTRDEAFLRDLSLAEERLNSFDYQIRREPRGEGATPDRSRQLVQWLSGAKDSPETAAARRTAVHFVRARFLREERHMDPELMLSLMERFGPMDWRNAAAHAVYWASQGLRRYKQRDKIDRLDEINTDRAVLHGLNQLIRTGTVVYDSVSGSVALMPAPRFRASYERALEDAKARVAKRPDLRTLVEPWVAGHQSYLVDSVRDYYLYGDMDMARQTYERLRRLYGHRTDAYQHPLKEFVTIQLLADKKRLSEVQNTILGLVRQAFDHGLIRRNRESADRFLEIAETMYDEFQRRQWASEAGVQGYRLPPWRVFLVASFEDFLTKEKVVLFKARAWDTAPDWMRRRIRPALIERLRREAEAEGLDPKKAFPDPPMGPPQRP